MLEANSPIRLVDAAELPDSQRYKPFGTAALRDTAELIMPNHAELPEGFEFTAADAINPSELAALMRTVDIGSDTTAHDLVRIREGFQEDGYGSVEIGVRSKHDNKLVGYGGLIYDINGDGEMGDFVVDPTYQGRGIGKAIIDQRLLQANMLGVRRIHIPGLEATNTLKHHYIKRGFTEHEGGTLVRVSFDPEASVNELSLTK